MLRRFVLIAALILCCGSKSAQAQLQNDLLIPSKWTVAVLFRVEPNKRTYIGTVQQPNLSLPLPLPIDPRIPSRFLSPKGTYDYEVWLACSGSTLGLAYHSKNGQFAHIYSSHPSSIGS